MNVIKYKYYSVITNEDGVYLLFTYLGLPFRDLTIGNINKEEAKRYALESIKPTKLESREEMYGEMLDLTSLISTFLPLEDINPIRSLNMTALNNTSIGVKDRLYIDTAWKSEIIIVDGSEIEVSYEHDKLKPERLHGILWIKKKDSEYAHLYILVEGTAILYVLYSDLKIEKIIDLTEIPNYITGEEILWEYDINSNNLNFGQQTIQYVPEKRNIITIDGFKLIYNNFYGIGTIQFLDYNYVDRKILIQPDKNWWKYTILYPKEPEITYITSGLA